ncbi:MAG: outer membrane lipoprotein chaperone LolA [Oxalobacter sp.]|nr:MAG: outer membrane lipoprotein chaperone LolA [Oxalobacter sp.]
MSRSPLKHGMALLLFFSLVPALACASALAQFKAFVASTQSAKGEFTQHRVIKVEEETRTARPSSGTFVFSRPGKFVWTYQKPYYQIIQADGVKLYLYDKDLNQVTIKKLGTALGSNPAAILFGSADIDKHFTLKEAGTKDGLEWLEVIPKSDTSFEKIKIGLQQGMLASMELHDSFGQVSILSFKRIEKNPAIKPGFFKFVIPKGADVMSR